MRERAKQISSAEVICCEEETRKRVATAAVVCVVLNAEVIRLQNQLLLSGNRSTTGSAAPRRVARSNCLKPEPLAHRIEVVKKTTYQVERTDYCGWLLAMSGAFFFVVVPIPRNTRLRRKALKAACAKTLCPSIDGCHPSTVLISSK